MLEAGELRSARVLAVEALKRDATVVDAVRTLGITAQATGNAALARQWLTYAQKLSRRDFQTNLWAIEYHVARGDTAAVLYNYDLALRTSVPARDTLFPILGSAIQDPDIARALIQRLRQRPLWYDAFLAFVATDGKVAPQVALRFLHMARQAGLSAPSTSLIVLVSRSLDAQDFDTAWQAYMLKRPGIDRRQLRDPDFGSLPEEATLFDWTLADDGSILAQSVRDDGGTSLNIEASPGTVGLAAQQIQILPPGAYRLAVTVAEASLADGSLTWTLTCNDGTELTKLATPASKTISAIFSVPADCKTQTLKLNVYAGDSAAGLRARVARVLLSPVG